MPDIEYPYECVSVSIRYLCSLVRYARKVVVSNVPGMSMLDLCKLVLELETYDTKFTNLATLLFRVLSCGN